MVEHWSLFKSTDAEDLARCMESLQEDGYTTRLVKSEIPLHIVLICGRAFGTILDQKEHIEEIVNFFGGRYVGWTIPVGGLSVLDLSMQCAEA